MSVALPPTQPLDTQDSELVISELIGLDKSNGAPKSTLRVVSRSHDTLALLLPLALASATIAVHGFNGDGNVGIVWQNTETREFAVWFLNQTNFVTAGWLAGDSSEGSRIAAIADFNRDGHPDLLWRSPSSATDEIWLMDGINRIARHLIPAGSPDFDVAGAGDFDDDGYPDILWRDPARNVTAVWFMDGANWRGRFGLFSNEPEFNWSAGGTGDFNHDGNTDIVWRDRYSGRNVIWLMKGTDLLESIDIRPEPDLGYQLVGTGAFNSLGNTDLLWRHVDGRNTVWLMSGTQYLASTSLPTEIDSNWKIGGTGGYTNVMLLSAIPNDQSGSLTLRWRHGTVQPLAIERRDFGQPRWDPVATHYLPGRFTESGLRVGQRYEYRVGGEYLLTGIAATPIEDRGKIILVVEEPLANQIQAELELLKTDLVGDGWSVIRTNVPRHDDGIWARNVEAITSIKSFITHAYNQDPARTKAVYLIGHVPIPYSGFHNPDGHGGRALPADVYYGDVDGIYTDSRVDFGSFLEGGPPIPRHDNLIGDGKFDQNRLPENAQGIAELELAVGRVDFSKLHAFGPLSEIELTQRYIQKTHRYRHKQFVLPDRVTVATYFPFGPNREAYAQALKIGSRLFGIGPSYVVEDDPFDPKNAALVGILGGFGLPFAIAGRDNQYHQTVDMTRRDDEPRLAFASVFASFCLDFDYPDNFMRAFLATPSYGLAMMWFRPVSIDGIPLAFEPLGLGETIGSGFVRSINESQPKTSANTYIALLGDPTLRLQVVAPPSTPPRIDGNITLEWSPSSETNATYLIYQSTNRFEGPWERFTPVPIAATNLTDFSLLFGPKMYQIRTVKLVTTGSGSYTNLSQGVFVEAQ